MCRERKVPELLKFLLSMVRSCFINITFNRLLVCDSAYASYELKF